MAETKDEKIIRECQASGEPFMVFRAKDVLALPTLVDYEERSMEAGCSEEFVENVRARTQEFADWDEHHGDLMKLPD